MSTGLKEIDDFEEIAYQPPDNMGADNLSDDGLYSERPAAGDHQQGAFLKSPPITTNSTVISSSTRRRHSKINKDGFSPSTSTAAPVIKTTANKKAMSNKNIAASKLKQLATKRKHVKQQQQVLILFQ